MTPYDPSKIRVSTLLAEEKIQEKPASTFAPWKIGGGAVVAAALGCLFCGPLLHHAPQTVFAASLPSDTDLELKGTYIKDSGRFVAQGRITNTGQQTAPSVEFDAAMRGFYEDKDANGQFQDARDTVVVDTLRNLRPGETRDFDYPIDIPRDINGRKWLTEGMSLEAHVKL